MQKMYFFFFKKKLKILKKLLQDFWTRLYVEEAEQGIITADELKFKIAPLYNTIKEKYGNIVRVK